MKPRYSDVAAEPLLRLLAAQALSRAGGAPLIPGNAVRILKDAGEHFPAWLAAIHAASRTVHLENYIIADDEVGRQFVTALAEKSRDGVRVRVIYDWLGSFGVSRRLWKPLLDAGGMVRCFNRPQLASPLGWLTRDHRKMLAVDGSIAFVTGLCLSRKWLGEPKKGIPPWRDTGLELRGPGVAGIEQAFAEMWGLAGPPLEAMDPARPQASAQSGDVALRVISAEPNIARLYRLDLLIAAMATQTLWLTDAYFLGAAPYVQALRAAARDGVDVRLLVPGTSDLKLLSSVSRAGYRPLLEAGVRVFEWNGSMLHAKAAVADGRWSRIGSSNLNLASWIGNYELDVAIEDPAFARSMEQMYEHDLTNATEIVLDMRGRVCSAGRRAGACGAHASAGSATRSGAALLRICNAVGAAIAGRRSLGAAESNVVLSGGLALLSLSAIGILWPYLIALPLALLGLWLAISLLLHARVLRAAERKRSQ